jgi:eukaryotic-like serine/threonine-protein kinase
VKWISNAVLAHLCEVADRPDLGGTRYELGEKIGQGGMGTVYTASDRELDRPVALKVLNALPEHAEARDRLVKEARVIARLEHPGIVPVHDAGVLPDGRLFYAMKLVRGKRLDEGIGRATALAERLQLFQKICDAVAFAHAHGVLHRDLKPQNVMLGAFGEVLVMDWGLAKEIEAPQRPSANGTGGEGVSSDQTAHGTVLGTPGYMAPEQARGESCLIDQRSDVYALGAILYFLLTGRAPIDQPLTNTRKAGESHLIPPRRFDQSIPRSLEAICRKALAFERAERYAGAAELSGDIADFLAGRRVSAYPEGPLQAAFRLGTKYRTVLGLILAYLFMRILLLLFATP